MEQEADVALDHLNHPVDVHHGLLIPSAQIGAHLRVEVLQLKHGCKITVMLQQRTKITIAIIVVVVVFFYLWSLQAAVEALDIFIQL